MTRHDGRDEDTVSFHDTTCIAETQKAILIAFDDEQHWVPKSIVSDDSEVFERGDEGELVVQAWWARKEGLVWW